MGVGEEEIRDRKIECKKWKIQIGSIEEATNLSGHLYSSGISNGDTS